ncbi:MAG: hypothetical protein P8105_11300 [Dehalococcoidia bacterium]
MYIDVAPETFHISKELLPALIFAGSAVNPSITGADTGGGGAGAGITVTVTDSVTLPWSLVAVKI